ncbi:MAG: thermonuclease family protein [Candidatus Omnitrophica bacterium]|nr:thermonuclease family protein [Candidatus Omnitrophota bacterium]
MTSVMAIAKKKSQTLSSYSVLLYRIRQAIAHGKERAQDAVERELLHTKWETGKLILKHILLNKDRAQYGEQVVKRLSKDLGISETEVKYIVEYARSNSIRPHAGELSWDKQRDLLSINEEEKRLMLTQKAVRGKWSRETLRHEIKKLKAAKQITVSKEPLLETLVAKKGELYTYKIVIAKLGPWQGKLVVDLGFSNYFRPSKNFYFKENEIVRLLENGKLERVKDATDEILFTFKVYLDEVTDADTLWVMVDLGFGFTTKQQLRLRGLDAPEIATRAGQAAKKFVERQLKSASEITITSTKSDKYDRYLADVFYTRNGKEEYLNNKLLQLGFAMRVNE